MVSHPPAFIDAESGLCFGLLEGRGGATRTNPVYSDHDKLGAYIYIYVDTYSAIFSLGSKLRV